MLLGFKWLIWDSGCVCVRLSVSFGGVAAAAKWLTVSGEGSCFQQHRAGLFLASLQSFFPVLVQANGAPGMKHQ